MPVTRSLFVAEVPLSPHLDFTGFDRFDLSREDALRSLESRDAALSILVDACTPDQKFSWLVLHRYYELCGINGKIPDWERHEGDWARNHFDREPLYRMTAVANVICHLFSKYTALIGLMIHEEDSRVARLEDLVVQLTEENRSLRARRTPRVTHAALIEDAVGLLLTGHH